MDRRNLLKTMGVAASATMLPRRAHASGGGPPTESWGMLIDTTRCVGCRTCEQACADANAKHGVTYDERADVMVPRTTSEKTWTVVNRFETSKGEMFVKQQCMHCQQPACASACLTKAMHRTAKGPVAWTADKCMGCRFCMVSCPFDVPKFEYFSANPRIQKCQLCSERVAQGEQPACAAACPADALMFGTRTALLDEARARIYNEPDRYIHEIYGEAEAGGTNVLYLSAVPFEEIGLRKVAHESYPALTKEFLYAVPVVIAVVPPMLVALRRASMARKEEEDV